MFVFPRFKLVENYTNKDEFKIMKICFHDVLGKNKEKVWSLVKIINLVSITPDALFEGVLQNIRYNVVREDNVILDFTIADFP